MLFESENEFGNKGSLAVTAFGMAGVGKTRLANLLRADGWFHYSADYRIGTRYMGEQIEDNLKREAMKVPFLKPLLASDSIKISSNIGIDNLEPLSTYLGTPGDPSRGGLPFAEYQRRQRQHLIAEIAAIKDLPHFIERANTIYGYDNLICDTGGSLIEVVDLDDPRDAVVDVLTRNSVLLYIRGTEDDAAELIARFMKSPKPMYYPPAFLVEKWEEFKQAQGLTRDDEVDPAAFAAWGFEALLRDRLPRYRELADRHGYVVDSHAISDVRDGKDFLALMRMAIASRRAA